MSKSVQTCSFYTLPLYVVAYRYAIELLGARGVMHIPSQHQTILTHRPYLYIYRIHPIPLLYFELFGRPNVCMLTRRSFIS